MKSFVFFIVAFSIIFSKVAVLYAQTETTISVSPAILDLIIKPGETTQVILTIRNGGGFALPVSVSPKSLLLEEEEITNKESRKASDASSWIKLDNAEFLLAENETKKVSVGISVPKEASPGGHYAQLSVRGLSLEQSQDTGASIVIPEVAVTVLVTVPGEVTTSVGFEKKDKLFPLFLTPGADFKKSFTVINNGNIHDMITPSLVIEKSGIELYRQKLSSRVVLPHTKKVFKEILQMPRDYGVYKAYIELQYANGQKTITTDKEVLLIAPKVWSIFSVAFLTFSGLYFYNHRKNTYKAWLVLTGKDS